MTRLSLHADDRTLTLGALHMELPQAAAAGDPSDDQLVTVLPAPGPNGVISTKGGPTHRVSDPAALAAALNAQTTDVRADFDHQTERKSHTYKGSTAAEGWFKGFRAAADGAILAVMTLSAWARHRVNAKEYRYLSPATWLGKNGEIMGLSSIALVNNPNMDLPALNDDTTDTPTAADLEARESAVTAREESAKKLLLNAATRVVDAAIAAKRLLPAQKEFALNAIANHTEGVEKGIEAFEAAYPAETSSSPALHQLDRRVAPRGAPAAGPASAAGIMVLPGVTVDTEQLTLHAQVAAHARERGISYRDAVLESARSSSGPGAGEERPMGGITGSALERQPIQIVSVERSGTDEILNRFVRADGKRCVANERPIGVGQVSSKTAKEVVAVATSGIVTVVAGAAIALSKGEKAVKTDASGRAVTHAGDNPVAGYVIDAATAADQLVRCILP